MFQDRYIPGLYDLAHVAAWEPYSLRLSRTHSVLDLYYCKQIPHNFS